jgi:hypothetical protein
MARLILLVSLLSTLVACGGGGSDSGGQTSDLREMDLSGTWIERETRDVHLKETGEYLYTVTHDRTLVIRDDVIGTVVNQCLGHGRYSDRYVVKTDKYLYTGQFYSLNDSGALEYQGSFVDDIFDDALQYRNHYRLTRISEDVIIDHGTLSVTGDFAIYEDSHVCADRAFDNYQPYQFIYLSSPYQDGDVRFYIRYRNDITPGVYSYQSYSFSDEVYFSLNCGATDCPDPYPEDVEVTFTNLSAERITGYFSFTDEYGSQTEYTGEFDIFPPQLP